MNNDLISRKELIKIMREKEAMLQKGLGKDAKFAYVTCDSVVRTIEQQPTAYNVDKVVEQLEGLKIDAKECNCVKNVFTIYECKDFSSCSECRMAVAVDVVKGGGVNGKSE